MKLQILFVLALVGCALADSLELDFENEDVIESTFPGDKGADKKVDEKPKDEVKVDELKVEDKVDEKPNDEVKVDDKPSDEVKIDDEFKVESESKDEVKAGDGSNKEVKAEDGSKDEVKIDTADDKIKGDDKVDVEPKPKNMEWLASYGTFPYYIYGHRYDYESPVMYPVYTYPYRYYDVKSYDPDYFYNAHGYYPAY